jgi:Holliday junction resolvase RusA-like endonuclease
MVISLFAKSCMLAARYKPIMSGPVLARFEFLMPIPKSRERQIIPRIEQGETVYFINVPDGDNLIKFYCDALNKVAYKDDRQVAKIEAVKFYSLKPATVIEVREC